MRIKLLTNALVSGKKFLENNILDINDRLADTLISNKIAIKADASPINYENKKATIESAKTETKKRAKK